MKFRLLVVYGLVAVVIACSSEWGPSATILDQEPTDSVKMEGHSSASNIVASEIRVLVALEDNDLGLDNFRTRNLALIAMDPRTGYRDGYVAIDSTFDVFSFDGSSIEVTETSESLGTEIRTITTSQDLPSLDVTASNNLFIAIGCSVVDDKLVATAEPVMLVNNVWPIPKRQSRCGHWLFDPSGQPISFRSNSESSAAKTLFVQ